MTLQEVIDRLESDLQDDSHDWGCQECRAEHEQFLHWLKEAQILRTRKALETQKRLRYELTEMCKQVETTNAEIRGFIDDYRRTTS